MVFLIGITAAALASCSGDGKSSHDSGGKSESPKASASADPSKSKTPGTVAKGKRVADVNGHKITGATYNRALTQVHQQAQQQGQAGGGAGSKGMQKQEKKQAVQTVVGNELLLQDSQKRGYKASKPEVAKQLKKTKKQYKTKKQLRAALKQSDMTMHQLRDQIAQQVRLDSYVKKELGPFRVSDKQVKQYYKKYKAQQKQAQQQQPQKSKKKSKKNSVPPLKQLKPQIKKQLKDQERQKKVSSQVTKLKKKGDVKVLI